MTYWLPVLTAILLSLSVPTAAQAGRGAGPAKLPRCLKSMQDRAALVDYTSYLTAHPNVLSAFDPCQYPTEILDAFMTSLEVADATGAPPSAPLPESYLTRAPDRSWVSVAPAEGYEIVAAKLAHILFVEVRGLVPWLLADYDDASLSSLFDVCKQMGCAFGRGTKTTGFTFQNVADHSPLAVWQVLSESIDLAALTDPDSGLTEIIKHARVFRHGSRDLDPDLGIITVEEMATERVSRRGCWSMSPYVLSLAAAMNIPGEVAHGYFAGQHHMSALFEAVDGVLAHGDDVYNAALSNTPAALLLDSHARWDDEVLRYKPLEGPLSPAGYNSRVHNYQMARLFPSSWTKSRYCGYEGGSATGRDFLESFFGSYATPAELDDLEARILETTAGCAAVPRDDPE